MVSGSAQAQHASDDPLASADDAFGLTLGLESIGMYNPGNIRGFNPQTAGNVRIDGVYFDQQAGLSNRVVEGSTIRIGVSEIGYAFPAPTGIVDYQLRNAGDGTPAATILASVGPFEAHGISIDGTAPVISSDLCSQSERVTRSVRVRTLAAIPAIRRNTTIWARPRNGSPQLAYRSRDL